MPFRNLGRKSCPWRQDEAGVAAIEFGLMAPFLMMLVVGTVEVGSGVYQAMLAQNAAEAGAVYASKHGFDVDGISGAVKSAGGITTPACILAGRCVDAAPAPSQFCGCPDAAGIVATDCALNCADGAAPGQYVRISAQITHTPIISFSGIAVPGTITRQAIVRMY